MFAKILMQTLMPLDLMDLTVKCRIIYNRIQGVHKVWVHMGSTHTFETKQFYLIIMLRN